MSKVKSILIIITIYVALAVALTYCIIKYQFDLGRKAAIEGQEKVVAHISALQPNMGEGKEKTYYNVYYEYWSEDGIRYSGLVLVLTTDREYALSLMGKEVEIYIDGKGNSILVSDAEDFDVGYYKNWCIIIGAIIAAYTVIWITMVIRSNMVSVPKDQTKRKKRDK